MTPARTSTTKEKPVSTTTRAPPNDRYLSVDALRAEVARGDIDTVVVALTDMQGRLQGKRMHAAYFLEHVLEPGHRGLQLPARRRRRHEHGRRLRAHLLGVGLRRPRVRARPRDAAPAAVRAGRRDGAVRPRPARPLPRAAVAAHHAHDPARPPRRARPRRAGRHRAGVHRLPRPRTRTPGARATATSSRSTSTTSTTRSSAAAGPSRCCARSATPCTPPGWTSSRPRASATSASTRSASSTPTR